MSKTNQLLAQAFARLSKGASRRKIYSRKAVRDGRPEVARFLRAMSASEAVQARRLFNSLIGKVDTSGAYLTTIFEKEIRAILENYTKLIDNSTDERPAQGCKCRYRCQVFCLPLLRLPRHGQPS
jgi:rubrerythrin